MFGIDVWRFRREEREREMRRLECEALMERMWDNIKKKLQAGDVSAHAIEEEIKSIIQKQSGFGGQ